MKKQRGASAVADDRLLIERNAKKIDVIAAYCGGEYAAKLDALREKLKYLAPSDAVAVYEWDNKISDILDDFKLCASVKCARAGKSIEACIVEVEAAIAERNARV